jgi:acyl-coenzyme A thioesterase PaaI-like protein
MKYTPASLRILGYTRRSAHWQDFVSKTMATWYKFSPDHSVSHFAWVNNPHHRNAHGTTHGGALMTYMDYCMAAHVWDLSGGKDAYTMELNNRFVRPARITRWLFGEVRHVIVDNVIELAGQVRANDPTGMLIMESFGRFTLPKELKVIDDNE